MSLDSISGSSSASIDASEASAPEAAPEAPPEPAAAAPPSSAPSAALSQEGRNSGLMGMDVIRSRLHDQLEAKLGQSSAVGSPSAPAETSRADAAADARVVASFKDALRRNDTAKVADIIARAPPSALKGIDSFDLCDAIKLMQWKDPASYTKTLDALTNKVGEGEGGERARYILADYFKNFAKGDALTSYVNRHLKPGPDGTTPPEAGQAAAALAASGNEDALTAVIRNLDPNSPAFAAAFAKAPPDAVDKVAGWLMQQAHARKDTALEKAAAMALMCGGTREGKALAAGAAGVTGNAALAAIDDTRAEMAIDRRIEDAKGDLGDLKKLKALNGKQGTSVLSGAGLKDLDERIAMAEAKVKTIEGEKEAVAKKALDRFRDPQVQQALAMLPPEERARTTAILLKPMANTQVGQEFVDKFLSPALSGKDPAEGATSKEEAEERKRIFDTVKLAFDGTDKSREAGLATVELFAKNFAARGEAAFYQATAKVLGKSTEEVGDIQALLSKMRVAAPGSPEAVKAAHGLEHLGLKGNLLKGVEGAFAGFSLAMSLAELAKDPTLKAKLSVAKDSAAALKIIGEHLEKSPELAKYAKFLGAGAKFFEGAAGVLAAVVGAIDMTEATKYLDSAGAIGHYFEAAGGVIAAGGVVFPPLAALGAVVGLFGFVFDKCFGDSDEERAIKSQCMKRGIEFKHV